MSETKRTPQQAKTFEQICKLKRDNVESGDFWMTFDEGTVYLSEQPSGEKPKASIKIPRTVFNRFVRFWRTGNMR